MSPVAQGARTGLAAGFFVRGVSGISATTARLISWTPDPWFVRLDRRYYGPPCLGISLAVAPSISGPR